MDLLTISEFLQHFDFMGVTGILGIPALIAGAVKKEDTKRRREREAQQREEAQRRQALEEQERAQALIDKPKLAREAREADIARGQQRGRDLFRDQLGRVSQERSGDIGDIISRRRTMLDQGMSPLQREQSLRGLGRQQQRGQRQLQAQLARSGVGGGLAAGQLGRLLGQQAAGRADLERNLALQAEQQRRGDIGSLEQSIREAEAAELARQQFNIGQVGRERFAELASGLAEAQLGAGERGVVQQAGLADALARAAQQSGGGGKK